MIFVSQFDISLSDVFLVVRYFSFEFEIEIFKGDYLIFQICVKISFFELYLSFNSFNY